MKNNFIIAWAFVILLMLAFALMTACNVTRTVTTTAQHYQRGDTTITIMTKTTESYDGSVKGQNLIGTILK